MLRVVTPRLGRFLRLELVWVNLILLILVTFFLADPIIHFPNTYYSPTDILQSFPPFILNPSQPLKPHNYVISDDILNFLSWHEFVTQSLGRGELPLWNPYNGGGRPLLANIQVGFFNPLIWPGFVFGQHLGLLLRAFLYLYLAGLSSFLYLRSLRLWVGAAVAGMIAFTFGGMVVVWQHTALGATFILLPLVLTLTEWRLTNRLTNRKFGLLLSLAIAWQVFSGHPETIYLNTCVETLYLLFRLVTIERGWGSWTARLKTFGVFLIGGLVGIVLSAVQLLPFLEYLSNSASLAVRKGGTTHYELINALAFLLPNPFGNPTYGADFDFAKPNYSEVGGAYVGTTIVFLALVSLWLGRKRPLIWFWLGMSLIGLEIVYGWWPFYNLVAWLSPISIYYERLVGTIGFFVICMASLTLHVLHERVEEWRKADSSKLNRLWWRFGVGSILGLLTLSVIFWWFSTTKFVPFNNSKVANFEAQQFLFVCGTFGLGLVGLVIGLRWSKLTQVGLGVFLLMLFLQVGWYGRSYRAATSAEYFLPNTPTLQALADGGGRVTIAGSASWLPAEINIPYNIEQINGYDALGVRWFDQLRDVAQNRYPGWDNPVVLNLFNIQQVLVLNKNPDFQNKQADQTAQLERSSKQLYLNIYQNKLHQPTYRVIYRAIQLGDEQATGQLLNGQLNLLDTLVLLPGAPVVTGTSQTAQPPSVKMLSGTANTAHLHLINPQPGYLYIDQTYFPGWQAKVNGQNVSLLRANVAFTALPIEAGDLDIQLEYDPLSFKLGFVLSLFGLIFWLLLANLKRIQRLTILYPFLRAIKANSKSDQVNTVN